MKKKLLLLCICLFLSPIIYGYDYTLSSFNTNSLSYDNILFSNDLDNFLFNYEDTMSYSLESNGLLYASTSSFGSIVGSGLADSDSDASFWGWTLVGVGGTTAIIGGTIWGMADKDDSTTGAKVTTFVGIGILTIGFIVLIVDVAMYAYTDIPVNNDKKVAFTPYVAPDLEGNINYGLAAAYKF